MFVLSWVILAERLTQNGLTEPISVFVLNLVLCFAGLVKMALRKISLRFSSGNEQSCTSQHTNKSGFKAIHPNLAGPWAVYR